MQAQSLVLAEVSIAVRFGFWPRHPSWLEWRDVCHFFAKSLGCTTYLHVKFLEFTLDLTTKNLLCERLGSTSSKWLENIGRHDACSCMSNYIFLPLSVSACLLVEGEYLHQKIVNMALEPWRCSFSNLTPQTDIFLITFPPSFSRIKINF
jgi:hypothetical protein